MSHVHFLKKGGDTMLNSIKEMIISILNILGEGQDRVNRMGIIIIPGNGSLCNNPIEDYQNGDE